MLPLSGWPRRSLPPVCSGLQCLSSPALISSHSRVPGMVLRGLGRLRRRVAICWARCGPYAPPMSSALRRSPRLMVLGALPRVRAMARTPLPARCRSAMAMRPSMHRHPASIRLGSSMSPRHRSESGRSLRPVERVLPLRQTFPGRSHTPTAWAARVKSVPPRTGSGGFARLAACTSRGFPCLVPSNLNTMFRFLPNPRCCDVH